MGVVKFGVKCALAGGAIYYLTEEGVWKSSIHTEKLFGKINNAAKPYIKDATAQFPITIPDLPNTDKMSYLAKNYWNKSVTSTFVFLRDLPEIISGYTQHGINMVVGNDNLKEFFGSLGAPQETPKAPK